ncbi:biotin carboxylase N-terminal domain-containing protein [Streptomyces sp. P1-3]|uniref:acetyl/propionyl/methylcrotonyl-CoA carboxylase subunit alpha n=1 Tax=Streptomyces sp. P1-3 TaxID=3421658 RepID=UPI003D36CEB9
MINSLLVANRGEIARRVFRTCRELGIATVAVYADPDAGAPHVREADAAVRLPGSAPADTYLRGDLIVRAALAAGADAVHPGYGFLSENAEFARAVREAGLLWVGPPPEAIEAMASKTRAKELMGIEPLTAVTEDDLPVLVKAAAGGGGRGMRVVRELADLDQALAAARAEAASAFGDGEVFVEPYIEGGRHVEVQVLADAHGTVWALGTRDCSLQRRHQKVIEEAPAPGLSDELRQTLHRAAVAVSRAVRYVGAGTVEFLVAGATPPLLGRGPAATSAAHGGSAPSPGGLGAEPPVSGRGRGGEGAGDRHSGPAGVRAHFLEMNTRLQVEHPVTEAVHGLDLVAWQLRIAEGERLPDAPPGPSGHAVEARLYAEDPAAEWRPQTGVLHRLEVPDAVPGPSGAASVPGPAGAATGAGAVGGAPYPATGRPRLRIDAGYGDGDEVGPYYDPMLAKVIAWAPTRAEAVRRLARALERARIHGPVTNRDLLVRSLRHPEFAQARIDTGFYDRHLPELTSAPDFRPVALAALAAALADAAPGPGAGLADRLGGWRNVPSQPQSKAYRSEPDDTVHEVRYHRTRRGLAPADDPDDPDDPDVRVIEATADRVTLEAAGVVRVYEVSAYADRVHVDTPAGAHTFTALPRFPDPGSAAAPGSLLAPMPGTVVRVADGLAEGGRVEQGQPLLWLEAMKMEHKITAPASGTLTALHVAPGCQVEVGALLAVVEPEPATGPRPATEPRSATEMEGVPR